MPHKPGHGRGVWETGKPSKPYTPTPGPVTVSRPEPRPEPSRPEPRPSEPSDFFGSMYVTPEPTPIQTGGSQGEFGGTGSPVSIGYNIGQVDPGLAAAAGITPTLAEAQQGVTGGFDVTYPSGPGPGITTDDTETPTDDTETPTDDKIDVNKVIKQIPGMALKGIYGGMMGIKALLDKMFKPSIEDFSNPNFLAVMNAAFKSEEIIKDDYVTKYKELISEALGSPMDEEEAFYKFDDLLEESYASAVAGDLGKSVQQNIDPGAYYDEYGMPQTMGELENLANIPVTAEMQGANPELAQMIFNARNELDRQTGGQGGGGGAGIPSLYAGPITTPDQTPDDGFKPGVDPDNPYGLPDAYSGWYDSPFNIPNPGISAAVVTPVTLPDGTVVNMPDPYTANQFQQYMASQTQTPATTPTPFDYSRWPQFGPAGGPVPNYVNQGLGQGPHFDYWNQIARTFPGMT